MAEKTEKFGSADKPETDRWLRERVAPMPAPTRDGADVTPPPPEAPGGLLSATDDAPIGGGAVVDSPQLPWQHRRARSLSCASDSWSASRET